MKVGEDIIESIIARRPYNNIDDFYERAGKIGTDKMVNIIKAGCLDCFNANRRQVMIDYIKRIVPERTKLTTANLPMLLNNNLVPEHLKKDVEIWNFRKQLLNKSNLYEAINKTHGYYAIKEDLVDKNLLLSLKDLKILDNGFVAVNSKEFEVYYDNNTKSLQDWLKTDEPKLNLTKKERNDVWEKYCKGNELRWEMNSVNLYYNKHEIDVIPLNKYFTLSDFNELPSEPIVVNTTMHKKRVVEEYKLSVIAGAVINKNKDKKYIELSTPTGAVLVKLGGKYNHYNKSVPGDASWFERGTLLIAVGYRLGDSFIARTYKDSIYNHSLMKIDSYNSKNVKIKMNKKIED